MLLSRLCSWHPTDSSVRVLIKELIEWGDLHTQKTAFFELEVLYLWFKKKHGALLGLSVLNECGNCSFPMLSFLCCVSCLWWSFWFVKPHNSHSSQHVAFHSSRGHGVCNHCFLSPTLQKRALFSNNCKRPLTLPRWQHTFSCSSCYKSHFIARCLSFFPDRCG